MEHKKNKETQEHTTPNKKQNRKHKNIKHNKHKKQTENTQKQQTSNKKNTHEKHKQKQKLKKKKTMGDTQNRNIMGGGTTKHGNQWERQNKHRTNTQNRKIK